MNKYYALKIPEIQKAFVEMMQTVVDRAVIDDMVAAIERNDFEAVFTSTGFSPAVLNNILNKLEIVYEDSAVKEMRLFKSRVRPIFNIRNLAAENDLKTFSSSFITNITAEARESVRLTMANGLSLGLNPRDTALNIAGRKDKITGRRTGGTIGLSSNQTKWVNDLRLKLANLDESYFQMGLRDKRFDSIVRKAIEEGKPLSQDKINQLVGSYSDKALKFRADMISRTETMQSINRGRYAAYVQAIEDGVIKKENVKKWWDDTGDGKTRPSHLMLGKMYGSNNPIPFDDFFVTMTGDKLMYPGDISTSPKASEIIHCRCAIRFEVDYANG